MDGLGGSDTLIVDYSSVAVDPFAGASPANVPSDHHVDRRLVQRGGQGRGRVQFVNFSNIEHLQVKLDFWHNLVILDGSALTLGASVVLDGGSGTDMLEADCPRWPASTCNSRAPARPRASARSSASRLPSEAHRAADTVTTGAGNDMLKGNGGDDELNSGGGNDILVGGAVRTS